jgi:hypothetical protein
MVGNDSDGPQRGGRSPPTILWTTVVAGPVTWIKRNAEEKWTRGYFPVAHSPTWKSETSVSETGFSSSQQGELALESEIEL